MHFLQGFPSHHVYDGYTGFRFSLHCLHSHLFSLLTYISHYHFAAYTGFQFSLPHLHMHHILTVPYTCNHILTVPYTCITFSLCHTHASHSHCAIHMQSHSHCAIHMQSHSHCAIHMQSHSHCAIHMQSHSHCAIHMHSTVPYTCIYTCMAQWECDCIFKD